MENTEMFEQSLMAHLSDTKLDKATLKEYSTVIAQLSKQNFMTERILITGIPAPDGMILQGRLSVKYLENLSKFFEISTIRKIDIFPLGIPNPDYLGIKMKIGNAVKNF
jgi:hypothetical protein